VTSSVINGFHHDANSNNLLVEFKSGARYEYSDVPLEKVDAMAKNASPGSFFSAKIRDRYKGRKL
jgi:hypothetical protein